MSKTVKSAPQTKTTPNQLSSFKGHVFTMGAAFAGVIFGVLGSMGFVGNYLDSQFAAQTASLNKQMVATAPASAVTAEGCYGTSSASATPGHTVAKAGPVVAHAEAPVGGRGGDAPSHNGNGGGTTPFVSQLISGSISNTGQGSTATINASNNYNHTQTNNNNINVSNSNSQSSSTGFATNSSNTNGGASSTGDSDNSNSTTTALSIEN